jgi:DNA polymerase-3 subunit delta
MKYNRTELNKLHHDMDQGNLHPVYLLFGERYLCARAAKDLLHHLLSDENKEAVLKIDGENENVSDTMNKLRTFSLFGTRQVIMVSDSRLFHSKAVGKSIWNNAKKAFARDDQQKTRDYLAQLAALGGLSPQDTLADLSAGQWKTKLGFPRPSDWNWAAKIEIPEFIPQESATDGASLVAQTVENGIPPSNHLIIIAETIDKRKKLFKLLDEKGVIIDLAVDTSLSAAGQKEQAVVIRGLIGDVFTEMDKRPSGRVVDMIIERTGFHPVAAVRETEKLCLYADGSPVVTAEDVETVTSMTREDALFELNEAFAVRNISRSLLLLQRLLKAGIHPLAVVATLRNLIRKLLFLRSLQDLSNPRYQPGQQFNGFKSGYLPQIKEKIGANDFLKAHPFVVFKGFQQAERFSQNNLKGYLKKLLDAEFNLKGSGIRESLILENFFLSTLV